MNRLQILLLIHLFLNTGLIKNILLYKSHAFAQLYFSYQCDIRTKYINALIFMVVPVVHGMGD